MSPRCMTASEQTNRLRRHRGMRWLAWAEVEKIFVVAVIERLDIALGHSSAEAGVYSTGFL